VHNAQVINILLQIFSNTKQKIDICGNSKFPSKVLSFQSVNELRLVTCKSTIQRYIFEITRENVGYCKNIMKICELRHLEDNESNFAVNDTECLAFVTMQKESLQATYSNIAEIVKQQQSIFETLWNKAIPAENRILEIENDIQPEFLEVISHRKKATDIYVDLARSVEKEALVLFANSKAIIRADRLGVLDYLINASNDKGALVRIISPITDENSQIIEQTCKKAPNIEILNGGSSHSGLIVVDNAKLLRFELKDPRAEEFSDAIGFVSYSNSKIGVYSSKSFFELLWNEHIQYERLKESDKMQREFINIAAHELRTPTQAILAFAKLIAYHPEKRDEMMRAICRNAERLQRLTDNILDVTRIESQTLKLIKEPLNINEMILDIVKDYTSQLEKYNGNVKVLLALLNHDNSSHNNDDDSNNSHKSDFTIEADRGRISQVISNLLSNAIKFTKEGSISINVMKKSKDKEYNDQEVIVSVKDTGDGIHPEILHRLFTKFATKSETGGTGLGLFISKSIVESHGGKMWAANNKTGNSNNRENRGATFSFTLPLATNKIQYNTNQEVNSKERQLAKEID